MQLVDSCSLKKGAASRFRCRLDDGLLFTIALTVFLRIAYSVFAASVVPFLKLDHDLLDSNDSLRTVLIERSAGLRYEFLGVWEKFDTLWYIHIATNGYDRPDSVVFYPLYPALIRIISFIVREQLAAALIVSTTATFFFFLGLHRLLTLDFDSRRVTRILLFASVWPASFIFFAAYAESLVVACIVWSIYFGRRGRWWLAGFMGLFAGLSKALGVLVVIPLTMLALRQKNTRSWPALLCLAGPVGFFTWLKVLGLPSPSEAYAAYWYTTLAQPLATIYAAVHQIVIAADQNVIRNFLTLIVVTWLATSRVLRPEYIMYTVSAVVLFLIKHTDPILQSTMRYVIVVFPLYIALGIRIQDKAVFTATLALLMYLNYLLLWTFLEWSLTV